MRPLFVLALLAGITAATGVPTLAWGTNIALPSEPSAMDRRLDRAYSFVRDGKADVIGDRTSPLVGTGRKGCHQADRETQRPCSRHHHAPYEYRAS